MKGSYPRDYQAPARTFHNTAHTPEPKTAAHRDSALNPSTDPQEVDEYGVIRLEFEAATDPTQYRARVKRAMHILDPHWGDSGEIALAIIKAEAERDFVNRLRTDAGFDTALPEMTAHVVRR
eukprot:2798121-Rhodomonas_salina.2